MLFFIFIGLVLTTLQLSRCGELGSANTSPKNLSISSQPESINTTSNSTVVFSCKATAADYLSFRVNNKSATDRDVIDNGFSVTTSSDAGSDTKKAELQVIAYEHNNNTEMRCRAGTDEPLQVILSNTALLRIQGLLDGVVDLDYTFINGSSVLLTWTTPYTLDNVPITGYYIVNGSVNITTSNKSIILSATNPDPCTLNNVSVSPINDVGKGSSNNISFYYETAPLITPPVSVVPVIDGQQLSLNISINVSELCKGEYPNSITVNTLMNNEIQDSVGISTQVNDQLMITGVITVPNNLNTLMVNVSLSNNGGEFLPTPSFGFGYLGPVTKISSSIDNCSTIDITWTAPLVDDRVSILYYILKIYDAITGSLVDTVSVYDTSYQFVNNDLFQHHYTYVITGVNELGEGISNNGTFSYQRVPKSVTEAASNIITFASANVSFNIPVILECTGEAPENATITIQCTGRGVVFNNTYLVEYNAQPMNIIGSVSVPQYQQCNISIVFSNVAGSSEPFIQTIEPTTTPSPANAPSSVSMLIIIGCIFGSALLVLLFLIVMVVMILGCLHVCKKRPVRGKRMTVLQKPSDFDSPEPLSGDKDGKIVGEPLTGMGTIKLPSAKTEGSVQYADIESVRPESKTPSVQSSDDEMLYISPNDDAPIGGDANLLSPVSKGSATTAQEDDGRNYVAGGFSHDTGLQFSASLPPLMYREKGEEGKKLANMLVVGVESYL